MNYSFQREYVKCGNKRCRSCPHGPYWYGYAHRRGRMHKKYFGKADPRAGCRDRADQAGGATDPREAIFNRRTATGELAAAILGLPLGASLDEIHRAYRKLAMKHHPDRGGDEREMKLVVAAYTFLVGSRP